MRIPPWLVPRLRIVAVVGGFAMLGRACVPGPPARSIEGVGAMLGASVHGHVKPGEFVWERTEGLFTEALHGRNVLFLASETEGGPRDLYRARVRVSLEGHPIAVTSVRNLTSTPLGDDVALTADGPFVRRYVAFASTAYGTIAGVTLLDLEGDAGVVGAEGIVDRTLGAITNLQETGTFRGIGRTSFSLETPAPSVRLGFERDGLVLSLPDGQVSAYDLAGHAMRAGAQGPGPFAAQAVPHLRKRPILWAVDTVRAIVGNEVIAAAEHTFFGARDTLKQASYAATGKAVATVANASEDAPPSPPLDASAAGDDGGYWPPPKLTSIWKEPEPGEGVWEPVTHPFLRPMPGTEKAPAYFYTTWVKPDAKRPYAKVLLVAMDMRQLELGMEGGVEDPKPLTGTKSFGRIPRDPDILGRVVGAFNGAFKTTHGAYGMMVDRRVLLPPKPEAATVVVTEDHRVGMGSWPASEAIPENLVSYRQNLDALVEDGKPNPRGREQWGFQLPGKSVMTQRSGICVTKPGHFMYVWGDDVSGTTLGKAMVQAGCEYGMHLDMNPKHTGFVFTSIRDVKSKDYDAKLLTREMEILPERYIEWSPKDFFFVMVRDPREPAGSPSSTIKWAPDGGTQPAPTWLPAVHETKAQSGGVEVTVLGIDPGRAVFRVRPGRGEAAAEGAEARDLPEDESKKVIAAMGLGNGRRPRPMGLALGGKQLAANRGKSGYLVVDEAGELRVALEAPDAAKASAIVELPLLVANGNVTMFAEGQGATRVRGAACTLPSGRLALAFSTASSDAPNAATLTKLGCKHVVGFDRGGHDESFLQRAGKSGPAVARGELTTLYAVASPLRPRAFAWKPLGFRARTTMTGIDIEFDVHVPLDDLQGPTSPHNFLRNFEVVVEIDGVKSIAGGQRSHVFPCTAGKRHLQLHVRDRSGLRPEWMLEGHATLFANADVDVVEGQVTRIRYVGDAGWFLTGKGSIVPSPGGA